MFYCNLGFNSPRFLVRLLLDKELKIRLLFLEVRQNKQPLMSCQVPVAACVRETLECILGNLDFYVICLVFLGTHPNAKTQRIAMLPKTCPKNFFASILAFTFAYLQIVRTKTNQFYSLPKFLISLNLRH